MNIKSALLFIMVFGSDRILYAQNIGIGTNTPTQKLDIDGQIRIRGGAPGAGKVLTSAADGTASWMAPPSDNYWTLANGNIYRTTGNVGVGTNSPLALLHVYGGFGMQGNVLFTGLVKTLTSELPISGSGRRMLWYLDKASFRAGGVTGDEWDDAKIGFNSVAMGQNTVASGWFSSALGNNTKAEAMGTTAIGAYNIGGGLVSTWATSDPLFEVGNGTSADNRNNAFTVLKNGRTGINMHNPTAQLHITAPANNVTGLRVAFGNSIKLDLSSNGGLSVGGYGYVAPDNGLLVYGRGVIANKLMIGAIETPVTTLHIRHTAINSGADPIEGIRIQNTGANLHFWTLYTVNSNGNLTLYSKTSGNAAVGNFNPGTGAYTATSNRHLKTNVQLLDADILTRIQQLQPASYSYLRDPMQQRTVGFMAEDVQPIFPELVDSVGENGENLAINYAGFSVVAIKAIQLLAEQVNELKQQVNELQKKLNER